MAAVVPAALNIVTASSAQEAGDLLAPFLETAAPRRGAGWLANTFSFSPRLRAAVEHGWRRGERFSQRPWLTGAEPRRGTARWSFTARHVPELLWREAYVAEFAPLLPSARAEPARRFCSVALVKTRRRLHLARSSRTARMLADRCGAVHASRPARRRERLQPSDCTRLADRYDQGPLTDYGARRAAFRDLPPITASTGTRSAAPPGVPPGRGPRRLAASAWIWSAVTGGDWRSAPAAPQTQRFPEGVSEVRTGHIAASRTRSVGVRRRADPRSP